MRRLFGSSKKAPTSTTPSDSILQMRGTLEMLEKKERHLDSKIASEIAVARTNAVKNKPAALMALKRKKMYEQQREHTRGARFNLETQILTIENANINLETLTAMKVGSAAMKNIHGEMDIDKVDDTMDDIREQMDLANEISSAISNPLGMETGLDEDELEAELEALEQTEIEASLLSTGPVATRAIPSTASKVQAHPSKTLANENVELEERTQEELDEEKELEELRASMAI